MSSELTPKQLQAAQLLASGSAHAAAAKQLKIRPETISRWLQQPAFRQEINRLLYEARVGIRTRLLRLAYASLDVVEINLRRKMDGSDLDTPVERAMKVLEMLGMEHFALSQVQEKTPLPGGERGNAEENV